MDINIGDKVVVKDDIVFNSYIKKGSTGIVTEITIGLWVTVKINGYTQSLPYYNANDYITKVDMVFKQSYGDPEYIRNVKDRLKELNRGHLFRKYCFKNRNKVGDHSRSVTLYITAKKELNYIYIILRQHNEMKKMYAKRKLR